MEDSNLRAKTISSLFFRFSERILAQVTSLVVSIILARLLSPDDYGVISLIMILITICDILVTYGFGNALIQKKDADQIDFSSCFYASLAIAIGLYLILFFTAKHIATYFDVSILKPIIKIMGIRVVVGAYNTIQHAYVSRHMMFKKFFFSTLFGTLIAGLCAVFMAYKGFGIWALVANYLVNTFIDTIILSFTIKWRPIFAFSFDRVKSLFSFGWKILLSGLIGQISNEVRSIVIAKRYTSADLAFYNKGESFPKLFSTQINTTISSVLFPVISNSQDNPETMKRVVRRGIKTITFLMTPMLLGLAAIGEPFVTVLLTDKWLPAVPFIRVFCLVYLLKPFAQLGEAFLNGIGESGLILKIGIVNKTLSLSLLIIAFSFGPFAIAVSALMVEIVNTAFMVYYFHRLISYTIKEQFKDLAPIYFIGCVMFAGVYSLHFIPMHDLVTMITQIAIGGVVYISLAKVIKIDSLDYVIQLARHYLRKNRKGDEKE